MNLKLDNIRLLDEELEAIKDTAIPNFKEANIFEKKVKYLVNFEDKNGSCFKRDKYKSK